MEYAGLVSFVILLLAAAAVGIYSTQLSNGQRKGRARFVGTSLVGVAFCTMSLLNLVGIHSSGHSSVTGVIGGLTQTHGKSSSSSFYVLGSDRQWKRVHCDYVGDRLRDGEAVAVDLLDFHSTLLRLTVLNGPYAGWSLTEGDGTIGSTFTLGLGLFLVYSARAKLRRDPEAQEEYRDNRVPLSGVDEHSLLHLSKSSNDANNPRG